MGGCASFSVPSYSVVFDSFEDVVREYPNVKKLVLARIAQLDAEDEE